MVKQDGGRILGLILHDEWREYQTIRVSRTKAIGATTQLELARMAFGGPPRYMAAGKMMLRLLGLFDPFLREFVEMYYLLTDPLIVDDSALQQLLGDIKKTLYGEGVRQSLAAAGCGGQSDWREQTDPDHFIHDGPTSRGVSGRRRA